MESKCLSVSMSVNAMVWYVREWKKERKKNKKETLFSNMSSE